MGCDRQPCAARPARQRFRFATTRDGLYGWTAERFVRKQSALGVSAYLYLWDHMRFAATPIPDRDLMPGMYDLKEAVMCRRRANGTLPWGWNVGVAAPKTPAANTGG